MKTVINTYLPFFPGFYESILLNSDTAYNAIQEECNYLREEGLNPDPDKYDFNYKQYQEDICNAFVDAFRGYKPDFVEDVQFTGLYSPRYYNYDTDRIYCNLELSDDWEEITREFIRTNYETLRARIAKEWRSYDGFISFISDNIRDWENKLYMERDPLYIQIIIGYYMENEHTTGKYNTVEDKIIYDTLENIYENEYLTYNE